MAPGSSKNAVLLAVIGNGFLTVAKGAAFAVSGSGAMLSESLHSLADTGNQALLLVGIRRSERPANATFHYGFGVERFFYALLSAVGIFLLGCGVTLYHGIHTLLHPPELTLGWLPFAVLGLAFLVDGFVLWKAVQIVRQAKGQKGFFEYLRASSDPTLAAVLLEDGVACLGVLIALAGILASAALESSIPDSIATLLIGGLMGGIAIWLGLKNRTLILGPAIPADVQRSIVSYLGDQPTIKAVRKVRTRIVGSDHFRFQADVDWNGEALAEPLLPWVEEQRERLDTAEGLRAFAREFGERLTNGQAHEVDRIEAELRRRHPQVAYIELESD